MLKLRTSVLTTISWLATAVILLVVTIPTLYLVVWSVFGTDIVGILSDSPTVEWFSQMARDDGWQESLLYSAILALSVSLVSSCLLLIHFYFMRYVQRGLDLTTYAMMFVVLTLPQIIYALSLRLLGGHLLLPEIGLVIIGNLAVVMPVQFFVMESAQERVPSNMLHAGSTLGASHSKNIFCVYLPRMHRALVTCYVLGSLLSFDELVIASFVIDSPLVTIPRRLWDQVNRNSDPFPAVVASLLFIVLLLVTVVFLSRRSTGRKLLF